MPLSLLITVTLLGPPQTVLQHGPDSPVSFYGDLMYFPHSVTSAYDRDTLTRPGVRGAVTPAAVGWRGGCGYVVAAGGGEVRFARCRKFNIPQ